jgi:hypothetical protein
VSALMHRPIRCLLGRHRYVLQRTPDKSGPNAVFALCARCGKERPDWDVAHMGMGGPA